MFSFFKKDKKIPARILESFDQLQKNDIVTFKERSNIPVELQGQSLTVKKIQAYQYNDGTVAEFVLQSVSNETFTASISEIEDGEFLTLSKRIPDGTIQNYFSLENIQQFIDDESFKHMDLIEGVDTTSIEGWVGSRYMRTEHMGTAFFYKADRRSKTNDVYQNDDSEELRYCEAVGTVRGTGFSAEIWEGGLTEFYFQSTIPLDAIAEMWPSGG
ncbi:MAG: hypothetical protein ACJA1S_000487 [Cellvibrionaceae bacterium]|jgi:hypothetical protein